MLVRFQPPLFIMAKRKGRPSKLTDGVQKTIVEGVEIGMPYKWAALRADIAIRTFENWMNRGEELIKQIEVKKETVELPEEDYRYLRFVRAVEKANADCMAGHLINVENHSAQDPTQSHWILERRFREDFTPRHDSNINLSGGIKVIDREDYDAV